MNESDQVRLRHMLDAAREVVTFTIDETRVALGNDIKLVRALSMSIGIIGEAASHVSQDERDKQPQIPWRQIIGMRNFLIHAYFKIDLEILWNTATQAIPALIEQLEQLLPEDDPDNATPDAP
ncbi:MAG: DUF86 domain-containing protein [Anaerolineae bacterium]|nr:DUF86 domain-containing protein [Anaerolineae bacterium]